MSFGHHLQCEPPLSVNPPPPVYKGVESFEKS